jgi:hypothetical protein
LCVCVYMCASPLEGGDSHDTIVMGVCAPQGALIIPVITAVATFLLACVVSAAVVADSAGVGSTDTSAHGCGVHSYID